MQDFSKFWTIGLMSGTSLDGIDAALLKSDGHKVLAFGPRLTLDYDDTFRESLRALLGGQSPVEAVERELTLRHAAAVRQLIKQAGIEASEVALLGFHGHTIFHAPDQGRTWQIGDAGLLARETGIDVIADFRSRDVSLGGQGAPFAPLFHAALARDLEKPLAVLNIGGVANVTWIGAAGAQGVEMTEENLIACDTGPGNALINDWVERHTGQSMDEGGRLAQTGKVRAETLAQMLDHPYFALPLPKSLDRDDFDPAPVTGLSLEDGAATLTAFTASAIARVVPKLPEAPMRWLVTGGGRHNPTLMAMLSRELAVPVEPVEAVGWDGDALEAQAFAYLAVRSRLDLPLSLPGTTGIKQAASGGMFTAA
ncbi:anhydro-N-acetylmuramic acid kinase [Pelagibius sp. Alg239-R121]|uniref:anhydro-N-acetylmuramic acid kinase n=1 Tax=Pelagibius sp. Alg239-R121 TaxID=2993448 RepID=UPI0024A77B6B|nr:anhydro-N-acetylmuramic acid kinase [Pelagibius sp. Alg239-R121]